MVLFLLFTVLVGVVLQISFRFHSYALSTIDRRRYRRFSSVLSYGAMILFGFPPLYFDTTKCKTSARSVCTDCRISDSSNNHVSFHFVALHKRLEIVHTDTSSGTVIVVFPLFFSFQTGFRTRADRATVPTIFLNRTCTIDIICRYKEYEQRLQGKD
jgi:hypothetical protein